MVPIVRAVGELVKVTVIALLVEPIAVAGNVRLVGAKATGATALPVRLTTCVAGEALSTMVTAPSTEPTALGEKLTVKVHVANGATVDPHVVGAANPPLTAMLVTASVLDVLVFFSVTVLATLVVPTPCAPKEIEAGVSVTTWPPAR